MYVLVSYKTRFNHYTNETTFIILTDGIQDYSYVNKNYHTGHIPIAFHHCVFSDDIHNYLSGQNFYHIPHI